MRRTVEDIKKTEQGRGWRYIGNKYKGKAFSFGLFDNRKLQEFPADWTGLGEFLGLFMEKPAPTDISHRSWILRDCAQRRALAEFWGKTRSEHEKKLKTFGFSSEDIEYDLKAFSADSLPEYLEALKAERAEIIGHMPKDVVCQPSRVRAKAKRIPKHQSGLVEPVAARLAALKNANVTKSTANINPDMLTPL
jgi:hypothetical protein